MSGSSSQEIPRLAVGELFQERYKITGVIGIGHFGIVYRAVDQSQADPDPEGDVALKMLRGHANSDDIRQEVEILHRLRLEENKLGDGINSTPAIIGYSYAAPPYFLAEEFMRGTKVSELLLQAEPEGLGETLALSITCQMLRLLDLLHEKLHKTYLDLKLENLWWQTVAGGKPGQGRLKVTDWNVLEERPTELIDGDDDPIQRDLFHTALYLYRMATGDLPRLLGGTGVAGIERSSKWQQISEGTRALLYEALIRKQFSSAAQFKERIDELLEYWQAAPDKAIKKANLKIEEAKQPGHGYQGIAMARTILSILALRSEANTVNATTNKKLKYLTAEVDNLKVDISRSIALFSAGSDEPARSLIDSLIPWSPDPVRLQWWKTLMTLTLSSHDLAARREEVIALALAFANSDYAHCQQQMEQINDSIPSQERGTRQQWEGLKSWVDVQVFYTQAQEFEKNEEWENALAAYQEVCKKAAHFPLELAQEGLSSEIAVRIHALGEAIKNVAAIENLNAAREHKKNGGWLQAGVKFQAALRADPGNQELSAEIVSDARGLYANKEYSTLLDFTGNLPRLAAGDAALRDLRQRAYQELERQQIDGLEERIERSKKLDQAALKEEQERRAAEAKRKEEELRHQAARGYLENVRRAVERDNWPEMVRQIHLLAAYPQYPHLAQEALGLLKGYLAGRRAGVGEELLAQVGTLMDEIEPAAPEESPDLVEAARQVRAEIARQAEEQRRRHAHEQSLTQIEKLKRQLKDGRLQDALQTGREWAASGDTLAGGEDVARCMAGAVTAIARADLGEEFSQVFGNLLGGKFRQDFARELHRCRQFELVGRFDGIDVALQEGDWNKAVKQMERLLADGPELDENLALDWQRKWWEVFGKLLRHTEPNGAGGRKRLHRLLKGVWGDDHVPEDLEAAVEAAYRRWQARQVQEKLKAGKVENCLEQIEGWEVEEGEIRLDNKEILGQALGVGKKLAEAGELEELRRFNEVFGRVFGEVGFGQASEERYWQQSRMELEQQFTGIRRRLAVGESEAAQAGLRALLAEHPVAEALRESWQQGWQALMLDLLSPEGVQSPVYQVLADGVSQKELAAMIAQVWPEAAEREVLYAEVARRRAQQSQAQAELEKQSLKVLRDRLARLYLDNTSQIAQQQSVRSLTLEGLRALVQPLMDLLERFPAEDPNLFEARGKTGEYRKILVEAGALWERARSSEVEGEQRALLGELRSRRLYGRGMAGDFEAELGLEPGAAGGGDLGGDGIGLEEGQLARLKLMQWVQPVTCLAMIVEHLERVNDPIDRKRLKQLKAELEAVDVDILKGLENAGHRDSEKDYRELLHMGLTTSAQGVPALNELVDAFRKLRQPPEGAK